MSGVSFDLALWAPESTTGLFSAKCNVPPHCRQDECTLGGFPSRTGQKKRPVGTTGKLRRFAPNFPVSFVAVKWLLWSGEWETVVWAEGWDMIDLSDFGQQLVHSEPEAPFFARQVIIEQSEQRSAPCVYESEKKRAISSIGRATRLHREG